MTIACLLACSALCTTTGAVLSHAEAHANERASTAAQTRNDLLAPTTYQQYLPLLSPSSVAACTAYTAIADGESIYVYFATHDRYVRYVHTTTVSKLQFRGETLYFTDRDAKLHSLSLPEWYAAQSTRATQLQPTCSSFLPIDDVLYYTIATEGITTVYKRAIAGLENPTGTSTPLVEGLSSATPLAYFNDELYFLDGRILRRLQRTGTASDAYTFPSQLKSILILDSVFACITNDDQLQIYRLNDLLGEKTTQPIFTDDEGGYKALCSGDGYIYAVQNDVVKRYSPSENGFTDFEICSSSAAQNRLHNAASVTLANDVLYAADTGNDRVSVYDLSSQTFTSPIATEFPVQRLAADDDTLLAACDNAATLFTVAHDETYGNALQNFTGFNGNIVGVENVYGSYYLVTDNNYFYKISQTNDGWTVADAKKNHVVGTRFLDSDAEGRLYVACTDKLVRFTEEDFLLSDKQGDTVCASLPTSLQGIAVDFDGNAYAYSQADIYRYIDDSWTTIDGLTTCVYGGEGYTPSLTSLTFGYTDDTTYLLYDGNYVIATDALRLPTARTIAVNGADDTVFARESVESATVVRTKANALMIRFDLEALRGAEVFPYLSYERAREERTAIQIGETEKYNLLAVFDDERKTYLHYLVLKTSCTELSQADHTIAYPQDAQKTAYVTSDVRLYKFPYITSLLTVRDLSRGASVTLLGEVNGASYAYYRVAVEENGQRYVGYLPQSFVTLFNPSAPNTLVGSYGTTDADADGVWRLAYILLGFAVICILTDYLLLRTPKRDEDDEEEA